MENDDYRKLLAAIELAAYRFIARRGEHTLSYQEFLRARELGIELRFEGEGEKEQGIDVATGKCLVAVDPRYFRPTEVETLLGDPTKARERLGWRPRIGIEQMRHGGWSSLGDGHTLTGADQRDKPRCMVKT